MTAHFSASPANAMRVHHDTATANCAPELVEAFAQMCEVGERPRSLKWKLSDAARNRPMRPLGTYPASAEALALSGKSTFYRISRPLYVQLARLRQICFGGKCLSTKERMKRVAKEGADSQIALTNLALAGDFATPSEIATADRELREELVEKELLAEELEVRMVSGGAK